jgi:hypothetical protein
MSDTNSIEDLLAELNGESKNTASEYAKETTEVETTETVETPETDTSVVDDLLIGSVEVPEPQPVKKRGRPKGSTKKAAEAKSPEPVVETPEIEVSVETAEVSEPSTPVSEATVATNVITINEDTNLTSEYKPKDIYILAEAQILNGHVYRRGQKITFVKGDKFYNSQLDRNGFNWLDIVDDLDAQYAKFGRVLVQPDSWDGIPIGSTENIDHPGIALAVSKLAQEEYKRNGVPFN